MDPTARGHLALLGFACCVAGSFSLGSLVANEMAPAALNAVRFVIALTVIGAAATATSGLRRRYFQSPWRYLAVGMLMAGYFLLMFEALKTASPVSTSAIFTLAPLMSAVFGWFLLRQRTTLWMAIALAVAASGALWVVFRGSWEAMAEFQLGHGEMLFFVATASHALYTPLVRRFHRGEPMAAYTTGTIAAALLVLLAFGMQDLAKVEWGAVPPLVWLVIVYLAVVASASSFFLLQYASIRLPVAKCMAYTYLIPSVVILWEVVLGHGPPSGKVLIGVALTIVALLMLLKEEDHGLVGAR